MTPLEQALQDVRDMPDASPAANDDRQTIQARIAKHRDLLDRLHQGENTTEGDQE